MVGLRGVWKNDKKETTKTRLERAIFADFLTGKQRLTIRPLGRLLC